MIKEIMRGLKVERLFDLAVWTEDQARDASGKEEGLRQSSSYRRHRVPQTLDGSVSSITKLTSRDRDSKPRWDHQVEEGWSGKRSK